MQNINSPILGDHKYFIKVDKAQDIQSKKMHLHAKEIKIELNKKKYVFKAELPAYFKKTIKYYGMIESYNE